MREFRLSAAGIILHQDKVLLVRYGNKDGGTHLVGPGGGVNLEEDLHAGLKREVIEETGLIVNPGKMLFVEDLLSNKYRLMKIWFLCSLAGGTLTQTEEAKIEGITQVGWFSREQFANETVYPEILLNYDWKEFLSSNFEIKYSALKKANF